MSAHITHPTPAPDVNAVLHVLLSEVQTVLENRFIGMYLYGSLASGDFDPGLSDIDFVVVTADELPDEMLPALEAMHPRITASGLKWATKLEGSYIPRQAIRRYDPFEVLCELFEEAWPLLPVSATTGPNLERLKQAVFERLEIIRVYSKPPGKEPDLNAPFVLKKGSTVEEFAGKVHQDFLEQLKSARVWGSGVYDGQMVGRDHVLHDGDVVELRI
jgi:predicted nucleotidyltransferase